MKNHHSTFSRRAADQSGFSLVEVMISMVVLTVGLLALLATLGVAMAANSTSQQDMIARQIASEVMESIFNARNTSQIGFPAIANTSTPPGIFVSGNLPLLCAGPDGIIGTADDAPCLQANGAVCPNAGVECLTEPGADGILGTGDDEIVSLGGFTRNVAITQLLDASGNPVPTLVLVTVTINYTVPNFGHNRTYILSEEISQYH